MSNARGKTTGETLKRELKEEVVERGGFSTDKSNKDNKAELDAFTDMVQNKLALGMAGLLGKAGKPTIRNPISAESIKRMRKKQNLKRAGASPGRIKAEFGTEMSRGGEVDVVDLTTEMEVNELRPRIRKFR